MRVLIFVLMLVASQNISLGCSLVTHPISTFETDQYIFIGEVVDVVGPFKTHGRKAVGEAWGLRVKVTDAIYMPQSGLTKLEVFPYRLTPWCGLEGWTKEKLLKYYPLGSSIRVIAKESTQLSNESPGDIIKLETSIYNHGSLARNLPPSLVASSKLIYDYRKYEDRRVLSEDDVPLAESNYQLAEFELRKDLLRLTEATSKAARIRILERLVFFPNVYALDYGSVARTYIKDAKTLSRLDQEWTGWKQKRIEILEGRRTN